MRALGLPFRIFAAAVAAGLLVLVGAARLASDAPGDGVTFLFVAPIALLAVAFGLAGGLLGAAAATAVTAAWVLVEDPGVSALGVATRSLGFAVVGGVAGAYADRARRALADSARRRAELEHSNRELERFASVAAHDLSEPLRTVSVLAQLLARRYEDRLDDTGEELVRHIVAGTMRMERLLDGLLEYARAGRGGTACQPVELTAVLRRVVRDLEARIEEMQATVIVDDLPRVDGDRTQLEQLFQNLLANALVHSGDAPPYVEVGARRDGTSWTVSVADRGPGVPEPRRDAIFDMFVRGDGGGSGVGLATCAKIAANHGGRVWVEPNAGGGSVFSVTLPA